MLFSLLYIINVKAERRMVPVLAFAHTSPPAVEG